MRPDSPADRAAALGLGALVLGAIAVRGVARLNVHPAAVLERAAPLAVVALGFGLIAAATRGLLVRRALGDRAVLEARPSEEHDPSAEQVRQLASLLARVHHTRGVRWLGAARAVRLQFAPDGDGVVRYLLAGPRGSRTSLEGACAAYPNVEVYDPPAAPAAQTGRGWVVRCELALARPSHEPLAPVERAGDVLGALATAMDRLSVEAGETATVALDVHVASPARARRLRARLQRQADPDHTLLSGVLDRDDRESGRRSVARMVERRQDTRGLDRKLDPGEVLLEFQLLLRVRARTREKARAVMRDLLAALDGLAAENHLRGVGLRVGGLGFLGADAPWRRRGFDRRLVTGRFAPRRRSIVTSGEIACLLSPPATACHADSVARTPGAIPAPPRGLKAYPSTGGEVVIPLGRVRDRTGERLVGVRASDTFFSYMAGRSRYGKTETAIGQFVALARAGYGGLFIDPHADALAEIKAYVADDPAVASRVVEIDASDRATGQPAWNLFAVPTRSPQQAAARVDAFVDALATTLGWDERNARALNLATQAAQALTELAMAAEDPGLAPTIFQVPTLLSDDAFREAALPRLSAPTREFFEVRFPRLPAEAVTAVTNLIDRLRAARQVAALLGRPVSTYDAGRALREDLIVLACPGPGSTRDRLLANLLVYDVLHAARARAALAPEKRRPFWVFLDELQTYDGPNLPALLEQSAKYGGRGFLFNQNPERLTSATWNAVSTNRSHLASTTVNARAARMIAAEWGTKPGPEVLTRLERYTYLTSVTLGGQVSKPFLVHGVPAAELHADHHRPDLIAELEARIDHTCGRVPIDQALREVSDHEARLRTHLRPVAEAEGAGGSHRIARRAGSGEQRR
jgi:hypothetical protein